MSDNDAVYQITPKGLLLSLMQTESDFEKIWDKFTMKTYEMAVFNGYEPGLVPAIVFNQGGGSFATLGLEGADQND